MPITFPCFLLSPDGYFFPLDLLPSSSALVLAEIPAVLVLLHTVKEDEQKWNRELRLACKLLYITDVIIIYKDS